MHAICKLRTPCDTAIFMRQQCAGRKCMQGRGAACCPGQGAGCTVQAQGRVCMRSRQGRRGPVPGGSGCAITLLHTLGGMAMIGQAHYQALHTRKQGTCTAQETGAVPRLRSRIFQPLRPLPWCQCLESMVHAPTLACSHLLCTLACRPPHKPSIQGLTDMNRARLGCAPRAASYWRRQRRRRPAVAAPAAAPSAAAPASGARLRPQPHAPASATADTD